MKLGIGLGIANSRWIIGASAPAMPSGALGVWYADSYDSGTAAITNSELSTTPSTNIWRAPRRVFTNSDYWTVFAITAVDNAAIAPDGTTSATTLDIASGQWYVSPANSNRVYPAGTYTLAINVRWRGTGSQNFRLGVFGAFPAVKTATASWQRFTTTVTSNGSNAIWPMLYTPDDTFTNAANFEICDFEFFPGSSDLGPIGADGHMYLGQIKGFNAPPVGTGYIDFNGASRRCLIQLPESQSLTTCTVLHISQKVGIGTSANFQTVLSKLQAWNDFSTGNVINSKGPGIRLNSVDGAQTQNGENLWAVTNDAWFAAAHRFTGTTADSFIGDVKLRRKTGISAPSAATVADLAVGYLQSTFYSGDRLAAVAVFPTALTDEQISDALTVMRSRVLANSSIDAPNLTRMLVMEGSSITLGTAGFPVGEQFAPNASPLVRGVNVGVGGSQISGLVSRSAALDALLPTARSGRKFILSVECGANDLGSGTPSTDTFLASLAAYCDARRAVGWTVVVSTILPRTDAGDGGTQFNLDRGRANTEIRLWTTGGTIASGIHADAVVDYASNATVGADSSSNNTTYYNVDKVHPLTAGYTVMEPIFRATVNAL